jgi:FkbM family methyltransferase
MINPRSTGKLVHATVPGSDVRLLVRLGSSDVIVFNEIFHNNEQAWNFSEPPKTIVDAGAYTGLSSAFFAINYPDAQVIAIEPSAQNFAILTRNVARFKNVQAMNAALWSERSQLVLQDPGIGWWGLKVTEPDSNTTGSAGAQACDPSVRAVTMLDVIDEFGLGTVDLLKLDIEGSEKELFSNSGPWIDRVDAICIELHDRYKPGCSRAFFNAVEDFPLEFSRGEKILVMRGTSPMLTVGGAKVHAA